MENNLNHLQVIREKLHRADRVFEQNMNEMMATVRQLEKNPTQESKERFMNMLKTFDMVQHILKHDEENEALYELADEEYEKIKQTQEALCLLYGGLENKGKRILKSL